MENETIEYTKKEKFWTFYFEFATFFGFGLATLLLFKGYILYSSSLFLISILNYGILSLYISHYNLKPFFFKLFPKKVQEKYK